MKSKFLSIFADVKSVKYKKKDKLLKNLAYIYYKNPKLCLWAGKKL